MEFCKFWSSGFAILTAIFLVCFLDTVSCQRELPVSLRLSNNGPAIFGSNITFYAYLENGDPKGNYLYVFQDNYPISHKQDVQAGLNASVKFLYPGPERGFKRDYEMSVTVYIERMLLPAKLVTRKSMSFQLSDSLLGEILIYDGSEPAEQQVYVSTNETVNLTFVLHDPEGFFKPAFIGYLWKIGSEFTSLENSIEYNFTEPNTYNVLLTVYATFPDPVNATDKPYPKRPYYGVFIKQIEAKAPINVVNVAGNTWLPHRDVLDLNITCNGSQPFKFCRKVFFPNETVENITCPDQTYFTTCSFQIMHYFPDPGEYSIAVYLQNDVSEARKTITVHSYDISHQMQLSVVIIPVVCSILAFVIIVTGIAWHIHNRKRIMIEVADFDFTSSEILIERTFFERLRDTLVMFRWKGEDKRKLVNGGPTQNSEDYIDEDYVPVV